MKMSSTATTRRKLNRIFCAVTASVLALVGTSGALQASSATKDSLRTPQLTRVSLRMVVSLPDRKLALLKDGKVVRIYRVAIGKPSTPSPVGEFKIINRVSDPTYYHKGQVIPAGKDNPVGSRWMGLSARGYGIHGTNQPNSIGKAASTGCIRMSRRDLEELFTLVEVGDAVDIRADHDERTAAIFGPTTDTVAQAESEIANASGGGQ